MQQKRPQRRQVMTEGASKWTAHIEEVLTAAHFQSPRAIAT
jgi:hypothetical protein